MACVLRVTGRDFDVDSFLNDSALKPLIVYHRGEPRFSGPKIEPDEWSGMNVSVSEREFSDLSGQIQDAMRFLSENAAEVRRLRTFPGVERLEMDFPIVDRDVAVQTDCFPSALLTSLGELQIGLSISRYSRS